VHVLTKIFIVLVSLLAVLLVPLVVVYATNEDNYRSKYLLATNQAAAANLALSAERTSRTMAEATLDTLRQSLNGEIDGLKAERSSLQNKLRQLESQLSIANASQGKFQADLGVLTAANKASADLTTSLVGETKQLRTDIVALERKYVEIDETLRNKISDLEVCDGARRALQEELARTSEERDRAQTELKEVIAIAGDPRNRTTRGATPVIADKAISATVVSVIRDSDPVLAEINAGSRDGVKVGWKFAVSDGDKFVANIRIIRVDINRATGTIDLEDAATRGQVRPGHRAATSVGD
jgi:hypothetical protein